MIGPKKLLAALAAIPPVALDDLLTETRRKADAERKAEEARRKQAEADAMQADIADLREIAQAAKEREHARLMGQNPEEVAAYEARMRKLKARIDSHRAALDRTLAASDNPAT